MRFILSVIISLFGIAFLLSPWGQSLDRVYYDSLYLLRGARVSPENIVIVAIDESSFDELDMRWPWPRSTHAKLVEVLKNNGAKVIGFDVLFSESSDKNEDQIFADSISNAGNVVLVNEMSQVEDPQRGFLMSKITDPAPIVEKSLNKPALGFANMIFDADGFVRRLNLADESEKAFSVRLAETYFKKQIQVNEERKNINFIGPSHTIQTVSYYQALKPEEYLPKDYFKDKIVVVGFVVASRAELDNSPADHYPIPFSKWHGGVMPGVEIHAHALENVLADNFISAPDKSLLLRIGYALGVLGGSLLFLLRPARGAICFLIISSCAVFICIYRFNDHNIYISLPTLLVPFFTCYIASPIFHYLTARNERAFIKKAFSTYLSPRLVTELLKNPDKLELGGEEREGTVMFLDIAGFTALSETLSAKDLVAFVNKYLGSFADEIIKADGMIDKYIGDCVMAVWGVPVYSEKHAEKAVRAVLKMQSRLIELNSTSEKLKNITYRVGLTSGVMLAGNVGGGTQFNYTVLGNEVNLASRLESLNKYYGTNVLMSERTKEGIGNEFLLRLVDEVQVKGQKKNEKVYELIGLRTEVSELVINSVSLYESAFVMYQQGKFEDAIVEFKKVLGLSPTDGPSKVMIERCQSYKVGKSLEGWDGVHVMQDK